MIGKFYVYEHWRPDLDLCFYVGKGNGRRARSFWRRNIAHRAVADHLASIGMCVEVRMVESQLTEAAAFALERSRIAFWRSHGVDLANRTDGGEGHSGFIRPRGIRLTAETKKKMSDARMGIKFTDEHRAKLSAKKLGVRRKPFTEETRTKMRESSRRREAKKRELYGDNVTRWTTIKEPA